MALTHPIFALALLLTCAVTAYLLGRRFAPVEENGRSTQLDGLRGIMAVSVFIHHASIWYTYLHSGSWTNPTSNLFNQLGQTSLSLFFMISSFLFVGKLLQFKGEHFNWKSFFIHRFFRIAPLHFFFVGVILLLVFVESDWHLKTSAYELASSSVKWLGFGSIGFAELNGMNAAPINSGVLWSLSYEWLLYLSLPLLSLLLNRSKPNFFFIAYCVLFISFTLRYREYELQHLLSFLGGAIAPFILKYNKWSIHFNHPGFTVLLIGLFAGILLFHSSQNPLCKVLIALAFSLIALGNSFFGLLHSRTLRFLGEISYSVYLLHGILLYCVIHHLVGSSVVLRLSPTEYWMLILATAPFLVLFSFISNRLIERPMIRLGRRF